MKLNRDDITRILCDQLELLAEVSKECKEKGETAVIPVLTDAMCDVVKTILL